MKLDCIVPPNLSKALVIREVQNIAKRTKRAVRKLTFKTAFHFLIRKAPDSRVSERSLVSGHLEKNEYIINSHSTSIRGTVSFEPDGTEFCTAPNECNCFDEKRIHREMFGRMDRHCYLHAQSGEFGNKDGGARIRPRQGHAELGNEL